MLAKEFGISRDTVYTYLRTPGEETPAPPSRETISAATIPVVADDILLA